MSTRQQTSIATTALLLLRVEARQICAVPDLANHLAVSEDVVRSHLQAMGDEHQVHVLRDTAGVIAGAKSITRLP